MDNTGSTPEERKPLNTDMPASLHAKLKELAAEHERTLAGEVRHALTLYAFPPPPVSYPYSTGTYPGTYYPNVIIKSGETG